MLTIGLQGAETLFFGVDGAGSSGEEVVPGLEVESVEEQFSVLVLDDLRTLALILRSESLSGVEVLNLTAAVGSGDL